jgi:tRNA nucleotidyltransferase (CCA-adding enzyme)
MSTLNIDIPNKIKFTLDKLHQAGYEAYVVGGCVRDSLLGKEPDDWDITTSATPEEIKRVFKNYYQIDTGLKHGTVAVLIVKELIEITTYRIDDGYSDGRRPDKVYFTKNIVEDLKRRDFTINACAMTDRHIVDPFGGQEDIKKGLIRCVGDPVERFSEDALRILRGIRFASVLGFEVEERTKKAMFECMYLLKNISQERITVEFCKTLLGEKIYDTLMEFKEIIIFLIPEVKDMVGFDHQNNYHIYDVYQHTLKSVELIDKDIVLRTTMFFHDIGKPRCFSLDKNSVGHFYGHAEISAHMAKKILKRMRFSNKHINDIVQLIKYHSMQIALTSKSIKRLLSEIGETQFRRLLKVMRADALAKKPLYCKEKLDRLDAIEERFDAVLVEDLCITLKDLAIDGHDLIALGIPQGKKIGVILNKLLEMVINEEIDNTREALINKVREFLV